MNDLVGKDKQQRLWLALLSVLIFYGFYLLYSSMGASSVGKNLSPVIDPSGRMVIDSHMDVKADVDEDNNVKADVDEDINEDWVANREVDACMDTLERDLKVLQELEKYKSQEDGDSKVMKHRFPQAMVSGIRKSGTQALTQYLSLHPHISSTTHAVHFFDTEENCLKGLDWYRDMLPPTTADQLTIDRTPSYFLKSKVPDRIHLFNSSMKFIVILRHPITRLLSQYAHEADNFPEGGEYPDIEELVLKPDSGEVDGDYSAVKVSTYVIFFKRWLEKFPRNQFHIVDGDKLVSDPVSEMSKVETFLGVEHRVTKDVLFYSEERGFYCWLKNGEEICLGHNKGRPHQVLSNSTREKLIRFFEPRNEEFFQLVGRRFNWT